MLQHDDFSLFESGAICKYLANVENSSLYPADHRKRALVDQWMDFFSCHLGRWLSALFFENIIKVKSGLGKPDPEKCEEATGFVTKQLEIINQHLGESTYFVGDNLSIADLFAFAYLEQASASKLDFEAFPNVLKWFQGIESRKSIHSAKEKAAR